MLIEELLQVLEILEDDRENGSALRFTLYSNGSGEILDSNDDVIMAWENDEEMTEIVENILEGNPTYELDI